MVMIFNIGRLDEHLQYPMDGIKMMSFFGMGWEAYFISLCSVFIRSKFQTQSPVNRTDQ